MTKLTAHRCTLPLKQPLSFRTARLHERDVVLVTNDSGAWAEAAPLPGFSREDADAVMTASAGSEQDFTDCPSLQFAADCLTNTDWPAAAIPVNALLTGSASEFADQAARLATSKCRAVKLKVGSAALDEDVERVKLLRKALRSDQQLRLDANRAWDWNTAIAFGKSMTSLGIEYIEEPLADPQRLETFYAETHCPYALDETLLEDLPLEDFQNAAALVVKPTLIGSVKKIESLRALGKPLVFSACFESGLGTLHIARLAAKYSPNIPAGLDTYSRLDDDVLANPLSLEDWELRVDGPPVVDAEKVAELSR